MILLILPANLSTSVLLFFMVLILVFLGGIHQVPSRNVWHGPFLAFLFILIAKAYPDWVPNRIDTWISRIENFNSGVDNGGNYQIERAKTAIATGGFLEEREKCDEKLFTSESSDFIYAIIVEELDW